MTKKLAVVFGIVFILVGILGFIPNPIVGATGYFVTNHLHDLVHLISGIAFLIAAGNSARAAGKTMVTVGVIYLVLTLVGWVMLGLGTNAVGSLLGVAMNGADNYLHLVLGVVFLIAGSMKPALEQRM